jgi:hypothetical protein
MAIAASIFFGVIAYELHRQKKHKSAIIFEIFSVFF